MPSYEKYPIESSRLLLSALTVDSVLCRLLFLHTQANCFTTDCILFRITKSTTKKGKQMPSLSFSLNYCCVDCLFSSKESLLDGNVDYYSRN